MILAPDRRIVTPSRRLLPAPFWRHPLARRPVRRRHRPHCPLYNMADGDVSLDSSGNEILDASGNVYLKCCCSEAGYYQARKCNTNDYYDLWVPDTFTLPFHFLISTVEYYVLSTSTHSATPGTLATTVSGYSSLPPGSICPCACDTSILPLSFTVTASGVTLCSGLSLSGSVNGTWCVPANVVTGSCGGELAVGNLVSKDQVLEDGSHSPLPIACTISVSHRGDSISTIMTGAGGYRFWSLNNSTVTNLCTDSRSGASTYVIGSCGPIATSTVQGYGGTITCTPNTTACPP